MPSTTDLAEYLLKSAPEHEAWSLVESPNSSGQYEALLQWAKEMTFHTWTTDARARRHSLGLVLIWLESEVARRQGGEGSLWPILSDKRIVPWDNLVHSELFTGAGHATQKHRDLLRRAAQHYALRHTFVEDEGQNWYRLIYLQFGFTYDDAVQRLAPWLSGQILPISVQKLLEANDSGAHAFQQVWRSLRMFRLGNLNQAILETRLKSNPWVLPEWCNALVAAAKKSSAQVLEVADLEAAEFRFITAAKLSWPEGGQPFFSTSLCNLDELKLESANYQLKAGDRILARLMRQADGSYHSDAGEAIALPIEPTVALSLVSGDGQIAAHEEVVLWDPMEEITTYSIRSAVMIQSVERLRAGAEIFLIANGDVTIRPEPASSIDLRLGYRLHRIAAGWNGQLEAILDDDVVWTSTAGTPSPPPGAVGVSAHFTQTLDLTENQWNKVAPPWSLPIHFRIPDGWIFTRLRWRRADGQIVELSEMPSHLTLTELDAVKTIVLRVRIASGLNRRTEVVQVPVPFVAAIRWTAEGNAHRHPPNRKLLLGEARRQTWSFSLPAGNGGPRDPRLCSFVEGRMLHGRLKTRPSTLPDLGGYGAALRVLEDPYVNPTPVLEITPCVLDDGVIGAVTWLPEEAGFQIKSRLTTLGEDHRILVWHSTAEDRSLVKEIPRAELAAKDDGWFWQCDENSRLHGVALEFRATRLGSWFDPHTWSDAAVNASLGEPHRTAAMLRSWKAPVLQNEGNHFKNIVAWLRTHWAEVLPVWIALEQQTGPDGMPWQMPQMTIHWQATVNELLTASLPSPDVQRASEVVEALAPKASGANALGIALWKLADVCPILAARVARIYLNELVTAADRQLFFSRILACPDLSVGDGRADELGTIHGNRDGFWLQKTVPTLNSIDQTGSSAIPRPYRLLAKTQDYRFFALGRWLREFK
jgi:hypothetical protein